MVGSHRLPPRSLCLLLVCPALLVSSIGFSLSADPSARQVQQAIRAYQGGEHAFRAGNFVKARSGFEQALGFLPFFPEAHIGMGHVAMTEKRFQDALMQYGAALDGYGLMGDALYDFQLKRYDSAQRQIGTYRDQIFGLRQALMTQRIGNTRKSEVEIIRLDDGIRQLEAMRPPDKQRVQEPPPEIFFHIGNAHFNLGRLEPAIRAWEDCAKLDEKFPLVFNNLAVGYWKQGRLSEAKRSLSRAEQLGFRADPSFKADLVRSLASTR